MMDATPNSNNTIQIYPYSGEVFTFPDASDLTFFDEYIEFIYKDAGVSRKALFFINNIIGFTAIPIEEKPPKLAAV